MDMHLTQALERARQMRGESIGVVSGGLAFTWRETTDRIARLASAFRALGLEPGDRVAILALNSHRSFETFFAAIWAGGVIAPLNHRLSAAELAHMMRDAEPKILIAGPEFLDIAQTLPVSCMVQTEGDPANGLLDYETLIAEHAVVPDAARGGDDLACLFYTGGTTGTPKGVMLSHRNIMANSLNFIGHIGMDDRTVHLHCGPLFHVAAAVRLFSVTQAAGTHVILPRFELPDVLETIEREQVTIATFVPTMLRNILDRDDLQRFDLSSLRHITYGAAPMPAALLGEAMAKLPGVDFVQSYGMTETSPIATMLGAAEHRDPAGRKLRSAGRAALLAELSIVDPAGKPLPSGMRGEVVVRGPMVMLGYWRQPDATADAIRNGWMHTGDIGYLDGDGYLFIVDRLKDVIISGGENVYSQEVEDIISNHPAVKECAVLGLPDARWGERVHAVIVPREGMEVSTEAIVEHCRANLAGFKCPKSVNIRNAPMPVSGANKILKTRLRDEALAGDTT